MLMNEEVLYGLRQNVYNNSFDGQFHFYTIKRNSKIMISYYYLFAVSITLLTIISSFPTYKYKALLKVSCISANNDINSYDYPFVILPGFGNSMEDYITPLKRESKFGLVSILQSRGVKNIFVVPVQRNSWLNIIFGIFTMEFWRNECRPLNLFRFYCEMVDETVRRAHSETGKPVIMVGHSAGGWLARAVLSNGFWLKDIDHDISGTASYVRSSDLVLGLVTLGAPHFAPHEAAPDMTRGSLRHVQRSYPGAHLSATSFARDGRENDRGIFYITVGGAAVTGDRSAPRGTAAKFAADSYLQVTGNLSNQGEEVGDGVVPLSNTHLDGALQITIPEAWHSIQAPKDQWYGGDALIDRWLEPTLRLIATRGLVGDIVEVESGVVLHAVGSDALAHSD